ncbi:LANO_0F16358g1_1 [Lachancea nothofagi CBS 11611]|uniref:LANO_0F16358g1_1 n=1 Tax=Lachancea nothofagi CBS 11611 TaxID=1266666 RepID=A0A1G4KCZ7_9SACH|nr:LANO_0F16358g1_1 [Lachancea nothofagi CBS 11611]
MSSAVKLFNGLNFVIVLNGQTASETDALCDRLKANAANECIIYQDDDPGHIDPRNHKLVKQEMCHRFKHDVHVIISETTDFWFYRAAAFDFLIPVVTPAWVEACISTKRITRASSFSPDPHQVLKNCQIYISRHSFNPTEYSFYSALIHSLGGICIDYLSSRASHIVTNDAQDPAIAAVASIKSLDIKYVHPTWAVQVFTTGHHVDETPYLLHPQDRPEEVKAKASKLWNYIEASKIKSPAKFLRSHKFYLSLDLILPSQCYNFLIDIIQAAGGDIIRHVEPADIKRCSGDSYIGQSIVSDEYLQARAERLHIGNVSWFFYMWCKQSFVFPTEKLLLSPLRRRVFQKDELVVGYTTYLGQQRHYIQKLVEALGGVSTTEFTKKNTHLITCFPFSQKYEAALRWKDTCKVVNHLWLEDCYRLQSKISCDEEKYTEIPISGGLATRLGQMSLDGGEKLDEEDLADTVIPSDITREQSKAPRSSPASQDGTLDQQHPSPSALSEKIIESNENQIDLDEIESGHDFSVKSLSLLKKTEASGSDGEDDIEFPRDNGEPDIDLLHEVDSRYRNVVEEHGPYPKDATSPSSELPKNFPDTHSPHGKPSAERSSPIPLRQLSPEMSSSPAPNGHSQLMSSANSRRAKEKAALKLHIDMESLNEFEQSLKRKKNRSLLPEELQKLKQLKGIEDKVKELLENIDFPEKSKGRNKRPYDVVAVCTGCHEAIDDMDLELLKALGITILKAISPRCNTIIAPKKMRTAKFLTSLSFHPLKYALLPDFITHVLSLFRDDVADKMLPNVDDYRIKDLESSVMERTSLPTKVFQRAGINTINLTDDVPGGQEVLSSILKAHGVQHIQVLPKKFMESDISANKGKKQSPTHILIAQKATQAKRFGKILDNNAQNKVLVVEWNWCVNSIFKLDTDLEDSQFVVYKN